MGIKGYVVVSENTTLQKNYQGIAAYHSWPLDSCVDFMSKAFVQREIDIWLNFCQRDLNSLEVVPDIVFARQYKEHCERLGIPTKLFKLEDSLDGFVCDDTSCEFLGWDYISSVDASYLFDDGGAVFELYPQELGNVKLNSKGLFISAQDAKLYAKMRRNAELSGMDIEHTGMEHFVKIFELFT